MATYIEMPKLSDTMSEGTLAKWIKNVGDTVEIGDVIAEVETDKATMEMEAFDEGILHTIYVTEGQKVPVGERLAVLVEEGEEPPSEDVPAAETAPPQADGGGEASEIETAPAATQASSASQPATEGSRVKASPLARKIAAEKGVDLSTVRGSGPGGRIVKADVEGAGGRRSAPAPAGSPSAAAPKAAPRPTSTPPPPAAAAAGDQRIPLTGMRSIIAERLVESKTTIPHFYLNVEVDAAPLLDLRKQINEGVAEDGNKYTVNDFVLKAVIGAAVAVPQVNASFDGDAIIQYGSVNLSVAIAVEDGLVTPVIRDAQTRNLLELSIAVKDLALRARGKKLSPDEFAGGTITVSNLGAYGIDNFDAIINPPQAAILSIGAAKPKPVVGPNGDIVPGNRMWIGMSCDHRVIDGAVGATYLHELQKRIENPALMLV